MVSLLYMVGTGAYNRLVIRTAAITAVQGCSWKELEQIYLEISRAAVSTGRQLIQAPDRMIGEFAHGRW